MGKHTTLTIRVIHPNPLRRLWIYLHCIYCTDLVLPRRAAWKRHMDTRHPLP